MILSTVLAQDDGSSSGGGAAFQLIFFVAIGALMYFLLIRPQRRRMRESQQLLTSLAEGDEVITSGGVYGFINAIDGETVWLDVADNVEIRIHRSAVTRKIDPSKESAGGPVAAEQDAISDPDDDPANEN